VQHVTVVRRALPDEAAKLTALAIRSKEYWAYDAAFMERAALDLEITTQLIEDAAAFVAESGMDVLGFYVLASADGVPMLRDLWVEPVAIGTGVGARLWAHMLERARLLGYRTVRIQSEPNAEGFYLKMDARRVGFAESTVVKGRMLPLMEIAT
jgi:GNAT superfamily N-acetyltransferase